MWVILVLLYAKLLRTKSKLKQSVVIKNRAKPMKLPGFCSVEAVWTALEIRTNSQLGH